MRRTVGLFGKFVLVGIAVLTSLSMVACGGGDSDGSPPATVIDSRTWYYPESLTDNISPDGQDAAGAQVAMDDDGNAIIVWQQSNGTVRQIFKSEYRNGSWTNPVSLDDNISPDGQHAYSPQVAMDNNGNAIIVWIQFDGMKLQIFKSEYRNGSWAHPTALTDNISPDGQDTYNPQVAMDNDGNAIIVWNQSEGGFSQIFMSEYRNGAWTHPTLADNINPDGSAGNPQVAMNNNGNAIIVWHQYEGLVSQIFKSEYRNGAWAHPASLADNISPDVYMAADAEVAMDDNGNAIIVWEQHDGSSWQIFKSEYRSGAWAHPAGITDKISLDGLSARAPKAAMDNNGNAIIVWEHDGVAGITAESIFKSEYRNGSWTHPASFDDRLNPDGDTASALVPGVAMGDCGNAIIIWQQYLGKGGHGIFKSEYR